MGRSIPSTRQSLSDLSSKIAEMEKVMRRSDAEVLQRLLSYGKSHAAEVLFSGLDAETGFIISVLIEVMKRLSMQEDQTK